ncbi:unnamed protein product [marine sediment metagenome]|uniref:DUF5673 domain-containing protein n=1 Tax=marine sediment metagenome TaxID=412755 RepID=X0X940_9ZZZZ
MAIEAPYSKYSKNSFKIGIVLFVAMAIIFAYDGYLSKYEWSLRRSFYEEHVKDGKPDFDMVFNQKSPFVFVGLAAVTTVWFWARKNKKLLADENELIISDKKRISYDSIQQIDKTYYEKKGFFVITYKDKGGKEVRRKLNDRTYDNLAAILEHLVAKIS